MNKITLQDINLYDVGNTYQIAGVLWTGNGKSFITRVPGKDDDLTEIMLMPLTLEDWQQLNRQADLLETEILQKDPTGITKIIVRKTQRQLDNYLQWACFKRDGYTCRYCGRDGIPLTVDHVDLWEDGGAAILENLVTACRACNKDRGRIKYEDWIVSKLYEKKAKGITLEVHNENLGLVSKLPDIRKQRVLHKRSR